MPIHKFKNYQEFNQHKVLQEAKEELCLYVFDAVNLEEINVTLPDVQK